jgi:hypothetical protein
MNAEFIRDLLRVRSSGRLERFVATRWIGQLMVETSKAAASRRTPYYAVIKAIRLERFVATRWIGQLMVETSKAAASRRTPYYAVIKAIRLAKDRGGMMDRRQNG